MSVNSYQTLERRIRALTFDTRQDDYVCDPDVVAYAIDRAVANVSQRLATPPAFVASFLTLVLNDYDYALGNTYDDTDALSGFRLLSTGKPIIKVDMPVWQMFRTGNPVATGDPLVIAFAEDTQGNLTAYVWPTPWQADTLGAVLDSGYTANDPAFREDGQVVYDVTIEFVELPGQSSRAVVYLAAAEMIEAMGEDKIAKLGINRGVSKLYFAQYEAIVEAEILREARLRRSGLVVERNAF